MFWCGGSETTVGTISDFRSAHQKTIKVAFTTKLMALSYPIYFFKLVPWHSYPIFPYTRKGPAYFSFYCSCQYCCCCYTCNITIAVTVFPTITTIKIILTIFSITMITVAITIVVLITITSSTMIPNYQRRDCWAHTSDMLARLMPRSRPGFFHKKECNHCEVQNNQQLPNQAAITTKSVFL